MRLVTGAAERGPIVSSAVVIGALGVLTLAVFGGLPVLEITPVITFAIIAAVAYRVLLSWQTLLMATIAVILLIPIRRYEMPGNLPFELEPYRLLVALIAAGWLASLLADPRVRLRSSVLDKPLIVIAFAAAASVIVNGDRVHALDVDETVWKKLTFLISFFIVFYLIVSVVRRLEDIDSLVKALVLGGVLVAGLGVIEARTGFNIFNNLGGVVPFLELTDVPAADDLNRGGRLRVYASAQHPIALGAMLVLLLPLAVYLTQRTGHRRWWLAAGMLMLGSLSSLSRTAVLMLATTALVFLVLRPIQTRRLWPALLPAAVLLHLALPGTIGTLQQSFFPEGGLIEEQRKAAGSVGSGRIADLGPSLDQVEKQPLLGYGYGTRIVDGPNPNARILDNEWLATLLETGLVGLVAWLWLFVRFIRRLGGLAKRDWSEYGWLATGIAASTTAFAVGMFTYDAFSFIQATFVLFFLLGLGSALLQHAAAAHARAEPAARH